MIRFIDLTTQYFCNIHPDEEDMQKWAFIDTATDCFLCTISGSHLFDRDDINAHPDADRLCHLIPRKFILSPSLANAIIDMENITFGEGLDPHNDRSIIAWKDLVSKAEAVTRRKSDSTRMREG